MKKSCFLVVMMCIGLFSMTGCTVVHPGVGQQAVLVEKPLLFGHGGIDSTPVSTGQTYAAISTGVIYVDVQPHQYEQDFHDLMTSDGVPIEFDETVVLQVTDPVDLIKNFGENWYQNNVDKEVANLVRQEVRQHGMNETAISTTAVDQIDAHVNTGLSQYLDQKHIPVKLIRVTVGRVVPPDAVKHQRVETATQEQRVQTENQRTLAENARKSAEGARAQADNAYRNDMGMNPQQFIELENIKMHETVCTHGETHCTFILNGSSSTPILDTRGR